MNIPEGGTNWRRLMFEGQDGANIELGNGLLDYVNMKDENGTLTLTDMDDLKWKCILKTKQSGPDRLNLEGTINGNAVQATLRRIDEKQFQLTKRRFHLINEW